MIAPRLGRALGPGRLERKQRGNGPPRWVLSWTDARGVRRSRALSTDRAVAERMRIELIRQRDLEAAGLGGVEGQSRPLAELVDLYVEDLAIRSSPRHASQVKARLDRVVHALHDPRVRDVTPFAVSRLRAQRVQGGGSTRTANLVVATLKAALTWGLRMGLIAANPIESLPGLPERPRRTRRALTEAEISRFLAAAEADDAEQAAHIAGVKSAASKGAQWALRKRRQRIPQAALWHAFLETGARYGELTAVTWADLDLQGLTLTLRAETTKSRRMRMIPLRQELADRLAGLRSVHDHAFARVTGPRNRVFLTPDGAVWPTSTTNARRVFLRVLERAGIPREDAHGRRVDIHALRTTVGSRLARNGVGLVQAQRLLGHSDPKLTAKHYVALETEDLRAAVEGLAPKKEKQAWERGERQSR